MKFLFSLSFLLTALYSPVAAQNFEPAPADKAVVYFVRASGLGALINFNHYDGDQLIGRFNAGKYLRYECEPGEHLFWARSENRSFVEADLTAGSTYLVEIVPTMGGLKAGVLLVPIDPREQDIPRRIQRLVTKRGPENYDDSQLAEWAERTAGKTENGLERYDKLDENDRKIPQLTADMAVNVADLRFVKKKRKQKSDR